MDPQLCLHICPHCDRCLEVRVLLGTPLTEKVTCGACGKSSGLFARPVQPWQPSSQPSSQPPQEQLVIQRREMGPPPARINPFFQEEIERQNSKAAKRMKQHM